MEYKLYKLKDLLSIKNGKDYKNERQGTIPVYGTGGIVTYIDKYLYDGESILLPRKGTLDNISYVEGKFWTIDTMYWSTINTDLVYGKYLYLYLSMLDLSCRDSGSTLPSMTFDAYYTLDIKLPSIDKQKSIANFIFSLIKKINTNTEINQQLESLAKTIYDYWFIQFDFPNENGEPYKSSGGKMVYNEELKREIPDGWKVENLYKNKLTTFVENGVNAFDKKEYLATANVNGTEITPGDIIEYETRESRANMQPTPNTVWFAKMKNSIKHLFFGSYSTEMVNKYILSTGFCGLACEENVFEYLNAFINSDYFEIHKDKLAHGATQEAVNNTDLKGIKFMVPKEKIINLFHKKAENLYKKIYFNKLENQKLVELRDFLLPLLMNGQVGFKEN